MVSIYVSGNDIKIGRFQENEYRQLIFPVGKVLSQYPDATFTILNQRPQDEAAYPVPVSEYGLDGNLLKWVLTAADLAYTGSGKCEVIAYFGSVVAKSEIYRVFVEATLDAGVEPPEPWEDFLADLSAIADRAESAKDDAEAAQEGSEAAQQAAETAQGLAEAARDRAVAAEGHAETYMDAAYDSQQAARQSELNAQTHERNAETSALAADQSAIVAATEADSASESASAAAASASAANADADRAEQAANTAGYMEFMIDDNGHVIYIKTPAVDADFTLEDGHLIMEVTE